MNKSVFMGRIVNDIELKYTTGKNMPVCKFTIAVPRMFKKDGQPDTDFFTCIFWDKKATNASKFLSKGLRVLVEGRMQNRSWDDSDGKKHTVTELMGENFYFADGKKENTNNNTSSFDDNELPL